MDELCADMIAGIQTRPSLVATIKAAIRRRYEIVSAGFDDSLNISIAIVDIVGAMDSFTGGRRQMESSGSLT